MTKKDEIRFGQVEKTMIQHEKSIIELNKKVTAPSFKSDAAFLGAAAGAENISLTELETTVKVLRKIKGQGFKQIQL